MEARRLDLVSEQLLIRVTSPRLPSEIRSIRLSDGLHRIGNDSLCEVPLIFPSIARNHALLKVSKRSWAIQLLSNRNEGYVSDTPHRSLLRLKRDGFLTVRKGAKVYFGPFTISFDAADGEQTPDSASLPFLMLCHDALLTRLRGVTGLSNRMTLNQQEVFSVVQEVHATQFPEQPPDAVAARLVLEFCEHGPYSGFIDDPLCREITANRHDLLFVDRGQGLKKIPQRFLSQESYEFWVKRLANQTGRSLDLAHPICEGALKNGSRLEVLMPPLTQAQPAVTIRRHGNEEKKITTKILERPRTALSQAQNKFLQDCVSGRKNILISGATGSGKTTLLRSLCHMLDPSERIIVIEDTFELGLSIRQHPNLVMLQAREPNEEGKGKVTLRELVRSSLRMHPDRIIVGECRGAEVIDMLQAMNSGHTGSMTTTHANSAQEALSRLELLVLLELPNVSSAYVKEWIRSSFHLVIQMEKTETPEGRVALVIKEMLQIDEQVLGAKAFQG